MSLLSNPKSGWYLMSVLLILTISVFAYLLRNRQQEDIDKNKAETIGTIIEYKHSGSSSRSTVYEYYVGSSRYEAYSKDSKRFYVSPLGLKYVVEYSTLNPSNSRIIWSRRID